MRKSFYLAFVLFMATMAFAAAHKPEFALISGNGEQTVKAGEKIETMVFQARYVEYVEPTVLSGLEISCPEGPINYEEYFTCKLFGRVTSRAPSGVYNVQLDAIGYNGDTVSVILPTTVVGMESDIELLSGSVDQTITAGDAIEPIVFRYRNLDKVFLDGIPVGINVNIDEETYTFTISGTTTASSSNRSFDYTIRASIEDPETSAIDTVYVQGTFTLNKTPGVVPCEVIENESQSVKPGEKIKPIVVRYANGVKGVEALSEGIPIGSFSAEQDNSAHTVTFTTTVPENYLNGSIRLWIYTIKSDGSKDTVSAVINVIGNINYTKMLVLENDSQMVAPGDSIKPIVLRYLNAVDARIPKAIKGFSASVDKTLQTITIKGQVPANVRDTCYKIMAYAISKDEEKNDTVYVTVNIVHKPVVTKVTLLDDDSVQVVLPGEDVEFVFATENATRVRASGYPANSDFGIEPDSKTHQATLYGRISESAEVGEYKVKFIAEGLDNNDSTYVTIIVAQEPVVTLVSGNVEQTVAPGDSIVPLVFKYNAATSVISDGFPTGVTVETDQIAKTITVFGKIDESSAKGQYEFTVNVDCYGFKTSTEVKITVADRSSSSEAVVESSSSAESSSSVASSSSQELAQESSSSEEHTTFAASQIVNSLKLSVEGRVLHVGGAEWVNVDVFDMQGRPVASFKQAKGAIVLDMLRQGNYIVQVRSGSNSLIQRISIK